MRGKQKWGGLPNFSKDSHTYIFILLFITVKIAHHRLGFSSIWPFLAFSFVPAFLILFIELDFHLNRFRYNKTKTGSNEESQGTLFTSSKMIPAYRWQSQHPRVPRMSLIHACYPVADPIIVSTLSLANVSWFCMVSYIVTLKRQLDLMGSWRKLGWVIFQVSWWLNRDLPNNRMVKAALLTAWRGMGIFEKRTLTLKSVCKCKRVKKKKGNDFTV